MPETKVFCERQLLLIEDNVMLVGPDVVIALDDLSDATVRHLCLWRGMVVEPRTVEVTATIVQEREFRYGFEGQLRERCASRTERIIKTEPRLKLWRSKKRGWYWI